MLEDFLKELIVDKLVEASLERLFLAVPLLGWGPFGIIITYFAKKYATLFFEEMRDIITIEKIKITNESFEKEYHKKSLKLKIISNNYGVDSPEFQEAKNEAKESLKNLVQFDIITS